MYEQENWNIVDKSAVADDAWHLVDFNGTIVAVNGSGTYTIKEKQQCTKPTR